MELAIFVWTFFSIYLSYVIGKYFIRKSDVFNFNKANKGGIRFSSQSKPIYGGVMMYAVFVLSIIFSLTISSDSQTINYLFTFLLTGTVGFFVGLADDLVSPSPLFKFFGQSIVAISLILMGITTQVSSIEYVNYTVTFLWVIGIMNSINLLDNMDAVSGSVSTIVLVAVLLMLLFTDSINFPMVILLAGTIGSLLGFLKFNWFPSRMYMGDNGSQFLGAVLAVVGIVFFWNNAGVVAVNWEKSLWVTVLAFIIPITDTTTVFVNRIARKQSPFVGGRDHTTHHLFYLGLTIKQVGLLLSFLSAFSLGLSIYIIKFVDQWTSMHNLIFGGYAFVIFSLIYSTTKISKPKEQSA
ncbi:MAG: undecaprenyl/decaprenyl-phosphate alpha-N-acetylglucosaminyl 1-phosphate transferase [Bacteroidales bacterium]|nr:undecaprenyl/decaprenyl-phosphate alpha-N-acetylglucosaminyl 1-phosphate transferase [Bacteroidales bacterium]